VQFGFEVRQPGSPQSPTSSVTESDNDDHDVYDNGMATQHHYDDYDDDTGRDDMAAPEPQDASFSESPGVMPPSLVGGVIRQARKDANEGNNALFMRLNACEILERDVITEDDFSVAPPTCPGRLQELRPGGRLPALNLQALKPTGSQTSRAAPTADDEGPSAYQQAMARRKAKKDKKKAEGKAERKRVIKEAQRRQQSMYSPEPEVELFDQGDSEYEAQDPDLSVCGTPAPVYRGALTVYGDDDTAEENALAIIPQDLDSSMTESDGEDSQDDGLEPESGDGGANSSDDEPGRFVDEDNGAVFIVDGMGITTVKAGQLPSQQNQDNMMARPPAKPSGQYFVPGVATALDAPMPDFPDLSRKPRFNPQIGLLTGFSPADESTEAAPMAIPSPSKLRKARQMKQEQANNDASQADEQRAAMYVMMRTRRESSENYDAEYGDAEGKEDEHVLQLEAERDQLRMECQTLQGKLNDSVEEGDDHLNSPGLKRALKKRGRPRPSGKKGGRPSRPTARPSQRPSKPMPMGDAAEMSPQMDNDGRIMMTVKRSPQEAHCPPHKPSKPQKPLDGNKQPRKAQRPQRPSRPGRMPSVEGAMDLDDEDTNVVPMARTKHRSSKGDDKEERRRRKKEKKRHNASDDENYHPNQMGDENNVMMQRTRRQPPPPAGRPTGRPTKPRPPTSKPPPKHGPPKPEEHQQSSKMDLPLTPMPSKQRGVRFEEPEQTSGSPKKAPGRARPRPRPPTSGSGVGNAAAALAEADAELAREQEQEKEDGALNYVSMAHTLKQTSSSSETNLFATCSMRPGQMSETMKREKAEDHDLFAVDHHVEKITFDERPLGFEVMFFNGHAIVNQSDAVHHGVYPGAVITKIMGMDVSAAARVPPAGQSSASSFLSDEDVLRLLDSSPLPLEVEFAVPVEEDEGFDDQGFDDQDTADVESSPSTAAMSAAQLAMANTTKLNQAFEQSWDCPLCTFENSILFDDVCQMCSIKIPPSFRQATVATTSATKAKKVKDSGYRGRAHDNVYALVDFDPTTKRRSRAQQIGGAFDRLNSDIVVAGSKARLNSYAGELMMTRTKANKGDSEAAMIATARRIPSLDSSGKGSCWTVNDGEGVDYVAVVTRIYEKHNPEKLHDPGFVKRTLSRYVDRETELLQRLKQVYCPPDMLSKAKEASTTALEVEESEIDRELAELQRRQDELLKRRASIASKKGAPNKPDAPKQKVGFKGPSAMQIDSHASSMRAPRSQSVDMSSTMANKEGKVTQLWSTMFGLKDEQKSEQYGGGGSAADYSFGFVSDTSASASDEEQQEEEDSEWSERRQQRQQQKAKSGKDANRNQLKRQSQAAAQFWKEYTEQKTQRQEATAKRKFKGREHGSVVPRWKDRERQRAMQLRCAQDLMGQADQLMDIAVVGTKMNVKDQKKSVRFCTSEDAMYAMDLNHECASSYSSAATDLNPNLLNRQHYAAAGDLISTSRVKVHNVAKKVAKAERELTKKSSFSLWGAGGKSEKKGMWTRLFGSKGSEQKERAQPAQQSKGVRFSDSAKGGSEPAVRSPQQKMVFNRSMKETLPIDASWVQQQAKDWLAQTAQQDQPEQVEKVEENANVVNMGRTLVNTTEAVDPRAEGFACTTLAISIRRWRCTKCTFDNELHNGECEMCENPREDEEEHDEEEHEQEEEKAEEDEEFNNNRIRNDMLSTRRMNTHDSDGDLSDSDDDVLTRTNIKRRMEEKVADKKVR
jgi:hypothetical protein